MLKNFRVSTYSRFYSIKHATKPPIKYTNTINLPKTKFPNRLNAIKREEVERRLLEGVFANAYRYQEEHNKEPTFVLHDGPPYANGDLHMGHAVNKILKDITLRHHAVRGQKVHYIPGWDCHGLPIELKAMATVDRKENNKPDALSIRRKSRQFALKAMSHQKDEFQSWGVLSDWRNENNVYLTIKPDFITNQLRLFADFYERGLVYRDLKPVYWSPSSRTALAEAELEYDMNFISPSVYVRCALTQLPPNVAVNQNVYALVWTTTPWTIPSNQAICYNPTLEYALVKLQSTAAKTFSQELYLIAKSLLQDFVSITGSKYELIQTIQGNDLSRCCYRHPIFAEQTDLPFYAAPHVQDTKGTGLVHTAPAHGPDDFLISLQQKLPVRCFVNEEGIYTTDAPAFLRGKSVLEEGNKLVLEHISDDLVFAGTLTHSYPIDWRTKKPVIIRASEQWFMNTEKLKERAVEEVNKIEIYPRINAEASKRTLVTQVQKRPYWCISRQRVWGVPIPVFYHRHTGKVLVNRNIIEHICMLLQKEGNIDFWWSKSVSEILPQHLLDTLNVSANDVIKGSDIFDIWFDSGSTWYSVLKEKQVADVYLEGYDQFTGWFQSSLLMSVAARNCAPYKALFVHGFTVDENGHKMSKSLGNVISPKDITKKYGVDVLRWWVAAHGTQNMSITVSEKLLQQSADSVTKIRATLRYLNGVIGDKSEHTTTHSVGEKQPYLNKYLLSLLVDFENELRKSYSSYEYNRAVINIQNFVTNQISSIYVHLIKDRLYCGDNADLANIRYTLANCYELLCKALWPITPFMVEESWSYYDTSGGFHQHSCAANTDWKNINVEQVVNNALDVKRLVNQKVNDINTWNLAVNITCASPEKLKLLQALQAELHKPVNNSELSEILQAGTVTLQPEDAPASTADITVSVQPMQVILCPRCRRFAVDANDCVCARCTHVLGTK